MRKVRNLLAAIAFLGIGLGIGACSEMPTASGGDDDPGPTCYWIDGVLHCEQT